MAYSNVLVGAGAVPATITVRRIGVEDLKIALSCGFDDFLAMPTHAIFLCLVYPLAWCWRGWLSATRCCR